MFTFAPLVKRCLTTVRGTCTIACTEPISCRQRRIFRRYPLWSAHTALAWPRGPPDKMSFTALHDEEDIILTVGKNSLLARRE
jgi:hypothetical protein